MYQLGNHFIYSRLRIKIRLPQISGVLKSFTNMSRQPRGSKKTDLGNESGRTASSSKSPPGPNNNSLPESSKPKKSPWISGLLGASSAQPASSSRPASSVQPASSALPPSSVQPGSLGRKNGSTKRTDSKSDPCPFCRKVFSTKGNLTKHMNKVHQAQKITCPVPGCGKKCWLQSDLDDHRRKKH